MSLKKYTLIFLLASGAVCHKPIYGMQSSQLSSYSCGSVKTDTPSAMIAQNMKRKPNILFDKPDMISSGATAVSSGELKIESELASIAAPKKKARLTNRISFDNNIHTTTQIASQTMQEKLDILLHRAIALIDTEDLTIDTKTLSPLRVFLQRINVLESIYELLQENKLIYSATTIQESLKQFRSFLRLKTMSKEQIAAQMSKSQSLIESMQAQLQKIAQSSDEQLMALKIQESILLQTYYLNYYADQLSVNKYQESLFTDMVTTIDNTSQTMKEIIPAHLFEKFSTKHAALEEAIETLYKLIQNYYDKPTAENRARIYPAYTTLFTTAQQFFNELRKESQEHSYANEHTEKNEKAEEKKS